jgi:glycosyltransferase involved in cell wall biosynthesis
MNGSEASSVTVVVPTFNRGQALRATLNALLASATVGMHSVEIIVVDDGSPLSCAPLVNSLAAHPPFTLRCMRQPNRGPGPARNTGFREAQGDIVIFVDDDILVPPNLIQQHVRAHQDRPRTVICGLATLIEPASPTPLYRFISALSGGLEQSDEEFITTEEFIAIDVPASGHISVERAMFDTASAIYSDRLFTPAAEEFQLAYRLRRSGIAIACAPRIIAMHDQPLDLGSVCRQQYKHALGAAEVLKKYPATRSLPALDKIARANLDPPPALALQTFKRAVVRALASAPVRKIGLATIQFLQPLLPSQSRVLTGFYRAIVSAHYQAGLRDGWSRVWS